MSSKNIHPSFFSARQNEVPIPSNPLLSRLSSSVSTIATSFFNYFNFFLLTFREEKQRDYQFITTTPSLKIVRDIFKSFSRTKELTLEKEVKGIKLLADLIQRVEKKPLSTNASLPLYEKKDSLFRKVDASPSSLNLNTFSSLFGLNHSVSTSSLKDLVDYAHNYFILQKNEKVPPFFPALKQAIVEKESLEKLIIGKGKTALERKAEELAASMKIIQEGNPFIYIGNVSGGSGSNLILTTLINQVLPKELQPFFSSQSSLNANFFRQAMEKKISEFLQNSETISDVLKLKEELSQKMESTRSSISEKMECILPKSWVMAVQKSLEEDCKEFLLGPDSLTNPETFAERIWNRMNAEGLEAVIKTSLEDFQSKGSEIFNEESKKITSLIKQSIPEEGAGFLGALGLGVEEAMISIEIERQNNGKLRLILFANKEGQLPLIYSDLDPKVLGKEFFFRLLSYQAFPKWAKGISYSLDDFFEGLIAHLGKEPSPIENPTLLPCSTHQEITNWSLTELFLRYHLKLDPKEFQKTLYNLRLQAFLDMWNETEVKQNPTLQSTLQSALDLLVKDSIMLFDENLLPLDHLKAMHATVKEWEEVIKKPLVDAATEPKTTLPPILQEILSETLTSCEITNEHIDLVKEAFTGLFGKEIEESLHFAIAEIIPTLSKKNTPPTESEKGMGWGDFFSNEIKTISRARISVLSFYKLYAHYSQVISTGIEFFVSTNLLRSFLETHISILATHSKATTLCAALLCYFGPTALHTIFPENVTKLLASPYAFYHEVVGYLRSRLTLLVLKQTMYHLLGSNQIAHITHLVKDMQQKTTRDGEISYDIRVCEAHSAKYHFIKNTPVPEDLKGSSSASEVGLHPQSIPLTKVNLICELNSWVREAEKTPPTYLQSIFYLNSQIRNLPIPKQNNGALWDEIVDIPTALESLHSLALSLYKRSAPFPDSEKEETMISLFAIYSIIDYLARRSPETHLGEEWKPNGCDLMVLVNNPFTKIKSARTYGQLESLAAYFDFDIRKRYTEAEIWQKRGDCLFNYTGCGKRTFLDGLTNRRYEILSTKSSSPSTIELDYADPLNFFIPQEAKYYRRLLEDPSIQDKLETRLGKEASDWEKYFCLFSDPVFQYIFPSGSIRPAVLPRPFYLLRFMHALLSSRTKNVRQTSTELSFTPIEGNNTFTGWQTIDKVIKKGVEYFHSGTIHMFRKITLSSTIAEFACPSTFSASFVPPPLPSTWGEKIALITENYTKRLFFEPGSRKQDEIMQSTKIESNDIGTSERKILEMVTSHKSDQVIRSIGYFTHNLERLSSSRFKLIFDLFIHNIGALESQLSDHPEMALTLGSFFHKGLNHFLQSQDYDTCLYLTIIGGETLPISEKFNKDAADYFPNFRSFIREKIIPELKHGPENNRFISKTEFHTIHRLRVGGITRRFGHENKVPIDLVMQSLDFLASSYNDIHPSELDGSSLEDALIDIARFSYSLLTSIQQFKSEKAVFAFTPLIRKAMDSNPSIRRKIIETLLMDGNIPLPQNYDGTWVGSFPEYKSQDLTINLVTKQSDHISKKNIYVSTALGKPSGWPIPLCDTLIHYPDHQVDLEIVGSRVNITKAFGNEGIKCRLTSCQEENGQKIWIEENPKSNEFLVVFTEGTEVKNAYYAKQLKDAEGEGFELLSKYPLNGETENKIDLTKNKHGLSLLSWFQPLEKISAFSTIQTPEKIARIEFREIENGSDSSQKLVFTMINNKAVSDGTFPGFSIAPI